MRLPSFMSVFTITIFLSSPPAALTSGTVSQPHPGTDTAGAGSLDVNLLTACIKHTSRFARRREMLTQLLHSIRRGYGPLMRILVADDGGAADGAMIRELGAELLTLPAMSGLSYGRNSLVRAVTTPYFVLLDDDVLFHSATRLEVLLAALRQDPTAALAAGCYVDERFGGEDCFNLRLDAEEGGAVVRARPATDLRGCGRVHLAHNFFVARTGVLRRFGWDDRQKVMEHETFYYQLLLNEQSVIACTGVSVRHNTTRDDEYRERSFRLKEGRFMQYLCKNFPELARFDTPYLQWRCDQRVYCSPAWHAQFPYDGRECRPMQWVEEEDKSTIQRPLISRAIHSAQRFPRRRVADAGTMATSVGAAQLAHHTPLLALVFTEAGNVARRRWQRATWMSFPWHRGYLGHELVPWRYVYVMARPSESGGDPVLDRIVGDTVTLSATTDTYMNLVYKTMAALRWALESSDVSFDVLLKVDDDSIVHIGRLWTWIHTERFREDGPHPPLSLLYAGRVFRGSQVIRDNFTRADLWRPHWFPGSFRKWAVSRDVYAPAAYPPYCGGGGYLVGRDAAVRLVGEYDRRRGKVIRVEDAFLGVLAEAQGLSPVDLLTFQEPSRGGLQNRETFIDQVLVHRVIEPYKAFRWLMLSSNCHAGAHACRRERNRTRGLPPQGALPTSPDAAVAEGTPRFDRDWISGPIPQADPRALTGLVELLLPHSATNRTATGRRKRKKKRKGRGRFRRRTPGS